MSNPNEFINVHVYDGQLKGRYINQTKMSNLSKRGLFKDLILKLNDNAAKDAVTRITNDLNTGFNYQAENDMDASDLLVEIITHPRFDIKLLEEQLSDMSNLGLCPSGRITRLYQVYKSLYE